MLAFILPGPEIIYVFLEHQICGFNGEIEKEE
jgi:hypothetical protein